MTTSRRSWWSNVAFSRCSLNKTRPVCGLGRAHCRCRNTHRLSRLRRLYNKQQATNTTARNLRSTRVHLRPHIGNHCLSTEKNCSMRERLLVWSMLNSMRSSRSGIDARVAGGMTDSRPWNASSPSSRTPASASSAAQKTAGSHDDRAALQAVRR